ncbi:MULTISPECIES: preprotein translocase subunit YajC [Candidatus Ichthyocystis]|uniref:preprotein translocase subunit YajC n=1 Tax=Candidatus Ichthyocystis TaxID=2929841 RepID=UPI000ABC9E87|nr:MULTISPECIES: preprotein translocase subunit YajC [Ichthyocystis]
MGFFTNALAATGSAAATSSPQQPDPWINIAFIVALFAVMYFLVIRPQAKKQKALKEMIEKLDVGNEVVTIGGLYGRIVKKSETSLELKIAENVQVTVQRSAVNSLLPKGTLEF